MRGRETERSKEKEPERDRRKCETQLQRKTD